MLRNSTGDTTAQISCSNPKVSVIVPCYNTQQFVSQSIQSILNQCYRNVEIIIIDDGSTEDIFGTVKTFVENNSVRYIRQHNQGQSVARNKGIKHSTGELIIPFDSDDTMPADYISSMVPLALDLNTVVVPDSARVVKNGIVIETVTECRIPLNGYTIESMLKKSKIPNPSMYSRKLYDLVGGYDENKILRRMYEDWDLYVRMFIQGAKFVNANNYYYYRMHDRNSLLGNTDAAIQTKKQKARSYVIQKNYAKFKKT